MTAATFPLLLMLALQSQKDQSAASLDAMRDRYRPLLIFAPAKEPLDPRPTQQMQVLQRSKAALVERQVMIVPFFHQDGGDITRSIIRFLYQEEATTRRRFHIHPNDFTVILLGKDGGEKFRSHTLVTIDQLNQIIDAMPMRQEEMRSRLPR